MASPHVAADLIQPNGLLTFGLFPNLSNAPLADPSWPTTELATLLTGFLDDGYTRASSIDNPTQPRLDSAALAWAYHRSYLVIWQRLSANPSTVSVEGQASQTYTSSQIATFEVLSKNYLSDFETFFVLADGEASKTTIVTSVSNSYGF